MKLYVYETDTHNKSYICAYSELSSQTSSERWMMEYNQHNKHEHLYPEIDYTIQKHWKMKFDLK